ncbi:hypothetical protein [Methanosarcina horonobensis]|uniref:hypothetical protein n=1 Tax=Methanosarcina horonobensis TaxID=418008 RepID=UPI00064FEA2A|nr:hypothetical protein [Methanosarcina horonobensis]
MWEYIKKLLLGPFRKSIADLNTTLKFVSNLFEIGNFIYVISNISEITGNSGKHPWWKNDS